MSDPRKARDMSGCADCERPYGDEHGFPDLIVPDDVWLLISPTGDFGGLLCPSCICKRAVDAGLTRVEARFTSGPFANHYEHEWTPRPATSWTISSPTDCDLET